MNWIWEDEISAITINRHVPCLEASFKLTPEAFNGLSDYLQELKRSLWRFREIYSDLNVIIAYSCDQDVTIDIITAFLKEVMSIVSISEPTKVAFINQDERIADLSRAFFDSASRENTNAKHFPSKEIAQAWFKNKVFMTVN